MTNMVFAPTEAKVLVLTLFNKANNYRYLSNIGALCGGQQVRPERLSAFSGDGTSRVSKISEQDAARLMRWVTFSSDREVLKYGSGPRRSSGRYCKMSRLISLRPPSG
jgi:hypothetical protein